MVFGSSLPSLTKTIGRKKNIVKVYADPLLQKLQDLRRNNLEKQILQNLREPTILKNSKLFFIESVHENEWKVQQLSRNLAPT